ncbi:TPA: M48 family metallopeptidase [Enterococcus faecium]
MQEIAYQVVRSNRKSVALVIDNEANLIVRAPALMPDTVIDEFVRRKKRWINEKQQQVAVFGEKHPPVVVETGESIMYLGSNYAIIKNDVDEVDISGNELIVPENYDIEALTAWLKGQAMQIISERVTLYANVMGVTPGTVKLSEAKARWGSCSTKNNLNFAWRLVMCPLSVIDYVVVHELSHITYKNHSPAFWARVKTVLPTYEDGQEWLKLNKKLMEII